MSVRDVIVLLLLWGLCATGCASVEQGDQGKDDGALVEGTTPAPDGVSLVYDVRGVGDTALLFVHCWTCNREFWREQVDAFADDYRVVTFDFAGHGASGRDRENWRVLEYGADVKAVADALGLERIILVGHSMGGPVALEAARLMPGRVLGVVCLDTLHDADFQYPEGMVEQMIASFEEDFSGTMTAAMTQMAAEGLDPAITEWIVERALATPPEVAIGLMHDFPALDLPQMFRDTGAPIRCINAMPPAVPPTNIEGNREYADYDAVIMEDVGHFLLLERPDEVNEHLRGFFAELDSAGD